MINTKSLDINLTVEVKNDDVIADMLFSNNTQGIIFLDSWTICEDSVIRSNIFNIVDESNKYVLYRGVILSRKVLPDDFIALNPGENIRTKITLNKDYVFTRGQKYFIRFCGNNPSHPYKQPGIDLLSNKVEITY